MSYATLAQLKAALRLTDANDDASLQLALDSAFGLINDHCQRTFLATGAVEARLYSPLYNRAKTVFTDDICSAVGLIVSVAGTVIATEVEGVSPGYRLEPVNAPQLGEPWTSIVFSNGWPTPGVYFPSMFHVSVTARYGYGLTIPPKIVQAEILQASRLFSRRQSPYGVAGSPDLGSELRLLAKVDPDVAVLLSGLVKYEIL